MTSCSDTNCLYDAQGELTCTKAKRIDIVAPNTVGKNITPLQPSKSIAAQTAPTIEGFVDFIDFIKSKLRFN